VVDGDRLKRVRWVIFDAVGTVIYPDPPISQAYFQIGRKYGSQITAEEVTRRFREAFVRDRGAGGEKWATDEAREYEFWKQTVADVIPDAAPADACFAELFDYFARPDAWACYSDVAATFETIRSCGLRLGIASNFDSRLNAVCEGHPELRLLDRRIISSEVGWKKPGRGFFEAAVRLCGVPADQILMVGDDLQNDVVAAREAGLLAVHLERGGTNSNDAITGLDELSAAILAAYRAITERN
jgi:putative hydrolase of the HAD superfamily